jgi:hypothetical protein
MLKFVVLCTNSDTDPVISEHTNIELLHHMRISTTYVSSVGIEAKWMKIQKAFKDEE